MMVCQVKVPATANLPTSVLCQEPLVKEKIDSTFFSHFYGEKRINPEKLRTKKLKAIPHKEGKLIYTVCVHVYV